MRTITETAEPAIRIAREGALGLLVLNRPKAINALTLGMVRALEATLSSWETDDGVKVVAIHGAGERGLCAGGDIRALYEAALTEDPAPLTFWREEYALNSHIARYPKPVLAIMSGIVMGGGIGISAHASHRVVTETTTIAMPEVGIGFIPDVGGTHLLSRAPGELGTHLALTADRVGAADAILLGLADLYIREALIELLLDAARGCRTATELDGVLRSFAEEPPAGRLEASRSWIDWAYSVDTVEAVRDRLAIREEPEAGTASADLARHSPTALKLTLAALRRARSLGDLDACLAMELVLGQHCIAGHDMREGIRAAVIDKDRKPKWSPTTLEEVTDEMVNRHFTATPDACCAATPTERGGA